MTSNLLWCHAIPSYLMLQPTRGEGHGLMFRGDPWPCYWSPVHRQSEPLLPRKMDATIAPISQVGTPSSCLHLLSPNLTFREFLSGTA